MVQQHINLGTSPGGQDGDTNRTALQKTEANFTELYHAASDVSDLAADIEVLQLRPGRNLLINALGAINQRGYVSGAATTVAGQYTVDRWKVQTSGQNLSWTTTGGVATFSAPAGGVAQVVDGSSVAGGSYVLSWNGTATATVNGSAVSKGAAFTLPANTNATVVFSGGTVAQPQLESGASPTSFDWRSMAAELALCQRYCTVISTPPSTGFAVGTQYSSTTAVAFVYLPVPMRSVPTTTITGPGLGWVGDGTPNAANPSVQYPHDRRIGLIFSISGATVGRSGYANGKAGGNTQMTFDAEF